jgi:hypothetical protein
MKGILLPGGHRLAWQVRARLGYTSAAQGWTSAGAVAKCPPSDNPRAIAPAVKLHPPLTGFARAFHERNSPLSAFAFRLYGTSPRPYNSGAATCFSGVVTSDVQRFPAHAQGLFGERLGQRRPGHY